jgi:hypothetical protein
MLLYKPWLTCCALRATAKSKSRHISKTILSSLPACPKQRAKLCMMPRIGCSRWWMIKQRKPIHVEVYQYSNGLNFLNFNFLHNLYWQVTRLLAIEQQLYFAALSFLQDPEYKISSLLSKKRGHFSLIKTPARSTLRCP